MSYTEPEMLQLTLPVLVWFSLFQQLPSVDCALSVQKPSYPGEARRFDSQATVTAHFVVGDDGAVKDATYNSKERVTPGGNDLLQAEVRLAIERTEFKQECKGDYTLHYRFVIVDPRTAEPNTRVEFNAPNEIVVTVNQDIVR